MSGCTHARNGGGDGSDNALYYGPAAEPRSIDATAATVIPRFVVVRRRLKFIRQSVISLHPSDSHHHTDRRNNAQGNTPLHSSPIGFDSFFPSLPFISGTTVRSDAYPPCFTQRRQVIITIHGLAIHFLLLIVIFKHCVCVCVSFPDIVFLH